MILLHVCCAPCSTEVISRLGDVTMFYYNPNIEPVSEYEKRLSDAKRLAKELGVSIIEGDYDNDAWRKAVRGLEDDPENGKRCAVCYEYRLNKTAEYAALHGFDAFTTTLTISPHKDADLINSIGTAVVKKHGVEFLSENFKKEDGYRKSIEHSHKHGLYRQKYCGCSFSKP